MQLRGILRDAPLRAGALEPAALTGEVTLAFGSGLVMNLACSYFQAHYLACIADLVLPGWRGRVFGGDYAAAPSSCGEPVSRGEAS